MQDAATHPQQPDGPSDLSLVRRVLTRSLIVIAGYLVYVAVVFAVPTPEQAGAIFPRTRGEGGEQISQERFIHGRNAWLAAGCQNCHSLYGLGGHSGPDLTNVVARQNEVYIRQVIAVGNGGMPAADIDEQRIDAILTYLRAVDATGVYPPLRTDAPVFGERR